MKTIKYKSDLWSGSVTLSDPLTLEQESAFEKCASISQVESKKYGPTLVTTMTLAWLPAILACVEKWNLSDFPEQPTLETFPARPIKELAKLVGFLVTELGKLYSESVDIPNASGPKPTPMPQDQAPSPES